MVALAVNDPVHLHILGYFVIILGLGSNLNNKVNHIKQAIVLIKLYILDNVTLSPLYASPALLPPNSPKDWDIPFLNMAIGGTTSLSPFELMIKIKEIEQTIGRISRGTWAPREIDIDILAYDDQIIDRDGLHVPHKSLHLRPFALLPLADIAPNWVHPVLGQPAHQLASQFAAKDLEKTYKINISLEDTHG